MQRLTADERLAFYVGRVVIDVIGKNTLQSFRSRIAKEIEDVSRVGKAANIVLD